MSAKRKGRRRGKAPSRKAMRGHGRWFRRFGGLPLLGVNPSREARLDALIEWVHSTEGDGEPFERTIATFRQDFARLRRDDELPGYVAPVAAEPTDFAYHGGAAHVALRDRPFRLFGCPAAGGCPDAR